MDAIIGAISRLLTCVVPPLCRCVQYHRKLHENMTILKTKLGELNCRKEDIEKRLRTECHPGKLPKAEVENWLQKTERINIEALEIEQNVKEVKYFSRAHLGKLILKKIKDVDGHYQSGSTFDSMVIDAPPSTGVVLPTTTIVGETTTKKTTDKILEYLKGNEVMKIGVCGMGGAGKTTIMTSINNKLVKETNNFTKVIWITVSQPLDLTKLQDQIATELKGNLPSDDKMKRAAKVYEMLEGKRFVLILDDMWEAFFLEDLGIPEPTEENGCKLVITTRSEEVCRSMDCQVINVECLPEDEALELFLSKVGKNVVSRRPDLKETIKLVVSQCAGLPLAIVTVAGSLKGEEDICEWRNALAELSENIKNVRGMEAKITAQLKFSYDRLRDERVQRCFLYCALYPEDFKISKCELISYWIGEGLVDERNSMQALSDKGHVVLNRLVRNCLLESVVDDYGRSVKMHDLIRDMALQITSQSPLFMVKAGVKLAEFPGKQEWKGDLEKVSLMRNGISEIPSNFSPNCQKLSTLLLQGNPLTNIPEVFFLHMPNLRILDLSHTGIKDLPNSICELRCLTTLLLNDCRRLQHVPSLAKLSSLSKLELGLTKITEVPAGMEMLEKLRYLGLYSKKLGRIPTGVLPKLFRLQKLRIFFGSETSPTTIEEVTKLRQLENFEGHFCNIKDFNQYVKYLEESQSPTPQNYQLRLGSERWLLEDSEYVNVKKHVELYECNICEREDSIIVLEDVQRLKIVYCQDLIGLSDIPLFNKLCDGGRRLSGKYSHLKVLYIVKCRSLKKLFSPKLLRALQNLEEIVVHRCKGIEEIIDGDVDELEENNGKEGRSEFTFPKLRKMSLINLQNLKSICSTNGVIVCDSLQEVHLWRCPYLTRLPLSLPVLPAIKEIEVQREWWQSLEWDDPNAKKDLEPYCRWYEG